MTDVPPHRRPRLLAPTGALLLSPMAWVLEAIADAGYDGAELLVSHNPSTRNPETIMAIAERTGVGIPVVHGPYMLFLWNVFGRSYVEKTRRSLMLAAALGAGTLVAHAPFRWERRTLRWLETEVDEEAADRSTAFAMENLFPVAGRNFSAAVTPDDMAGFRHVVFDTSHFAVAGVDLFRAWDRLADRVVHIHLSDNLGVGKDNHAPIGSGILPLEGFLGHVGRSGYAGTITLELDCRAHLETRAGLVGFLSAQRRLAERLLSGEVEAAAAER